MNDKDLSVVADLETFRRNEAMSQTSLSEALRVSQGHLSKVLAQKVGLSDKLRRRILALIGGRIEAADEQLERDVLRLTRASASFRDLMHAAIRMHKSRK